MAHYLIDVWTLNVRQLERNIFEATKSVSACFKFSIYFKVRGLRISVRYFWRILSKMGGKTAMTFATYKYKLNQRISIKLTSNMDLTLSVNMNMVIHLAKSHA